MLSDIPEGVSPEQWKKWEEDAKQTPVRPIMPETVKTKETFDCEIHGKQEIDVLYVRGNMVGWKRCEICYEQEAAKRESERKEQEAETLRRDEIRRAEGRRKKSAIPLRFQNCTFDNYKATNDKTAKILASCQDYAEKFPEKLKNGAGLILCGNTGTGKTHLSSAIAHSVLKTNSVLYTTTIKALRHIKSTYGRENTETEQGAINHYIAPDLLILDEVGVQYGSDSEHNLIFEIMNDRYENMKPTIVISNLSLDGLRQLIGDRVIDRQKENGGKLLVFEWESARSNKPE